MATIAVFLALGGGAYAAFKVPNNSVGTKQLKNGAVTGAKVKQGSLLVQDFKSGEIQALAGPIGPVGPKGDTGAKGDPGAKGDTGTGLQGDRGPSNAIYHHGYTLTNVPAGDYVFYGQATDDNSANNTASDVNCTPGASGAGATVTGPATGGTAPANKKATIPFQAVAHLPNGGNLFASCGASNIVVLGVDITAIQVGTASTQ
jgi:hypothetical protein